MQNITGIMLALLFFSGFVSAGAYIANSWFGVFNPGAITDVTVLDKSKNLTDFYTDQQNKLSSQGANTLTGADIILTGGWSALLSTVTIPLTVGQTITDSSAVSGIEIPIWFIVLITGAVSIFVIMRLTGIGTRSVGDGV